MLEEKMRREYEKNHRKIGDPQLDELFERINNALGIELYIWQKTYITMGKYRQTGATTAEILRLLLFSETTPLDYTKPPKNNRERFEREQMQEIQQKLKAAGIKTRKVFWNEKDKKNSDSRSRLHRQSNNSIWSIGGTKMQTNEDIKEMAKTFREAADILDEMASYADNREGMTKEEKESKKEELLGRFAVKMMKIQSFS